MSRVAEYISALYLYRCASEQFDGTDSELAELKQLSDNINLLAEWVK